MATPSERPPELEAEHEGITELVCAAPGLMIPWMSGCT